MTKDHQKNHYHHLVIHQNHAKHFDLHHDIFDHKHHHSNHHYSVHGRQDTAEAAKHSNEHGRQEPHAHVHPIYGHDEGVFYSSTAHQNHGHSKSEQVEHVEAPEIEVSHHN